MPSADTARVVSSSPSSSPIAINSERSSTYFPAQGFSITATAAARRVGGEISRSISRCVSSTNVAILRILALIFSSPQSVFPFDLRGLQTANTSMYPGPSRHHQRQKNLIRARRVVDTDFYRVEVAADIRSVDVRNRDVEPRSRPANFFCGRYNRLRPAQHFPHAVSAGRVPKRSVFDLSRRSYNRAFAITLDHFRVTAE